jgi:5-methylcytosine-specific restriction endonuclease McrA
LLERKAGRAPPMHPWRGGGTCKWCDRDILWGKAHQSKAGLPNKRRFWCTPCAPLYLIAASSDAQRRAVQRRGDDNCACCGVACYAVQIDHRGRAYRASRLAWEADHRRPLWSLPALMTYAERAQWYGLANLQLLCVPCHKAKSAREAGWRKLGVYGIALMMETIDEARAA